MGPLFEWGESRPIVPAAGRKPLAFVREETRAELRKTLAHASPNHGCAPSLSAGDAQFARSHFDPPVVVFCGGNR